MSDSVTEITRTGYFGRVGNSIKGVVVGVIFFFGSFALLAWNEGRGVKEIRSLEEGQKIVVNVEADNRSPQTEGMLVFMKGRASTDETLSDPEFPVQVTALKLRRVAEMYQWDEEKDTKSSSGEKRTTYSYSKKWSEKQISSSGFHSQSGHQNPSSMPFRSQEVAARNARVGVHRLSDGLVAKIKQYSNYAVDPSAAARAPAGPSGRPRKEGEFLYYGQSSANPEVGDIRIRFEVVLPLDVSFVAKQVSDTFSPYQTKAGNQIELLETGLHDSEYVFQAAFARNAIVTWVLRAAGWFLMFLGLLMMMGPIAALTDFIPVVGGIVALGTGLAAFVLASVLSIVTIAISWIAVRPVAGACLLVIALGCTWGMGRRGTKKLEARRSEAVPPPPPSAVAG